MNETSINEIANKSDLNNFIHCLLLWAFSISGDWSELFLQCYFITLNLIKLISNAD